MSVPCPLSTYVSKDLACHHAWKGTETETCLYAPMACAIPPTWHALPTPTGVREILLGKPAHSLLLSPNETLTKSLPGARHCPGLCSESLRSMSRQQQV